MSDAKKTSKAQRHVTTACVACRKKKVKVSTFASSSIETENARNSAMEIPLNATTVLCITKNAFMSSKRTGESRYMPWS
jgi:hypothetical protein